MQISIHNIYRGRYTNKCCIDRGPIFHNQYVNIPIKNSPQATYPMPGPPCGPTGVGMGGGVGWGESESLMGISPSWICDLGSLSLSLSPYIYMIYSKRFA